MTGEAFALAAESLAGCRFRLHGRDPATGLDCLGVISAALDAIGRPSDFPSGYTLRSRNIALLLQPPGYFGFTEAEAPLQTGDVAMVRMGPCQYHFIVQLDRGRFVHANAGLGRVIVDEGPIVWPVLNTWRIGA